VDQVAIGVLGPAGFVRAQHQITARTPGVVAMGCWCGPAARGDLPAQLRLYGSPSDMLACDSLMAIAVGAPLAERAYWCEQVAGAGKVPICAVPPGHRRPEIASAMAACTAVGRPLRLVDRSDVGPIADGLECIVAQGDRTVYFALDVQVDRRQMTADGPGVLVQAAVGYLGRLAPLHGPLESVWAETRSLLWDRPAEDVAVAYLRAMDGCEGVLTASALGLCSQATLRLHGRHRSVELIDSAVIDSASAWQSAYAKLSGAIPEAPALPLTAGQAEAGMALTQWITRAARARRPLHHREAEA
jgi:hypothetical protein